MRVRPVARLRPLFPARRPSPATGFRARSAHWRAVRGWRGLSRRVQAESFGLRSEIVGAFPAASRSKFSTSKCSKAAGHKLPRFCRTAPGPGRRKTPKNSAFLAVNLHAGRPEVCVADEHHRPAGSALRRPTDCLFRLISLDWRTSSGTGRRA